MSSSSSETASETASESTDSDDSVLEERFTRWTKEKTIAFVSNKVENFILFEMVMLNIFVAYYGWRVLFKFSYFT
jgi:hypothetical protein